MSEGSKQDNWERRAESMLCRTCIWYVPKGREGYEAMRAPIGRCRRHAPAIAGFPAVYPTDWCGDHKIDENRV